MAAKPVSDRGFGATPDPIENRVNAVLRAGEKDIVLRSIADGECRSRLMIALDVEVIDGVAGAILERVGHQMDSGIRKAVGEAVDLFPVKGLGAAVGKFIDRHPSSSRGWLVGQLAKVFADEQISQRDEVVRVMRAAGYGDACAGDRTVEAIVRRREPRGSGQA